MINFKFLSENDITDLGVTEDEINTAIEVGRRAFLEGHGVDYNPYLRTALQQAFDEGWDLERSYQTLNQEINESDDVYYEEGWESARSGYPLHHNPYPDDTIQSMDWTHGWYTFIDNH